MDEKRKAELRTALETKQAFIRDGINKGVKVEEGGLKVTAEDWKALQTARDEIKQIQELILLEELGGTDTKGLFDALRREPASLSTAVAAAAASAGMGEDSARRTTIASMTKSLGELFTESEEFKELRKSGGFTMRTPFELEVPDVTRRGVAAPGLTGYGQKDVYTGSVDSLPTRGFGRVQVDAMVPRAQRPNRVRDLFPAAGTTANLIDYFAVLGFVENDGDGNAGMVREWAASDGVSAPTGASTDTFGLKPKSNLRFESRQAPVRTIAHWEAAHRNVLADEPQLQATINNELLYGLALKEDDQILNGSGDNEELTGIFNTLNTQNYDQVATDLKSDALRRAATLTVLANLPGTGYVLHPFDWEDIELQKADYGGTGPGQYLLVTNFAIGAATQIWRQPVVETPAMTEGKFLTGAFGLGAQLYDRAQATIRIAEQHEDFFVRNAVAILAEQRLALAVKRPETFVIGNFA